MQFEIHSHEGAGPIRFGMSPAEVRAVLGSPFRSFKRASECEHPCDSFRELACFVYYDASGKAEAVEFASPAEPMLDGVNLLALSFSDLVAQLSATDPDLIIDRFVKIDGLTSLALGVGAYTPGAEEIPSEPIESVIVFARGYYDADKAPQ